jgi:hypothetical protein
LRYVSQQRRNDPGGSKFLEWDKLDVANIKGDIDAAWTTGHFWGAPLAGTLPSRAMQHRDMPPVVSLSVKTRR